MTLIRRNQNWLPNVFNDMFDNGWVTKTSSTAPAINVVEHKDRFEVERGLFGTYRRGYKSCNKHGKED